MLRAEGEPEAALAACEVALESGVLGLGTASFKLSIVDAIEAALQMGEEARAIELLQTIEQLAPGEASPFLRAHGLRLRVKLSGDDGGDCPDEQLSSAAAIFRDLEMPFWLAMTLLEHAERLAAGDRPAEAEPLVVEARGIFEELGAAPFLERIDLVVSRVIISA